MGIRLLCSINCGILATNSWGRDLNVLEETLLIAVAHMRGTANGWDVGFGEAGVLNSCLYLSKINDNTKCKNQKNPQYIIQENLFANLINE